MVHFKVNQSMQYSVWKLFQMSLILVQEYKHTKLTPIHTFEEFLQY